jgi:hypothetical protein
LGRPTLGENAGAGQRLPRRFHSSHTRGRHWAVGLVLIGALGAGYGSGPDAPPVGGSEATGGLARVDQVSPVDSLALDLRLPAVTPSGTPLPIVLRVENRSARRVDLYLRGRAPTFDVVVERAGGEPVWRRLQDAIIPAIVHVRTLEPGERVELEAMWDQRTAGGDFAAPGDYMARGFLLTEGGDIASDQVGFRIVMP